MSRPQVVNGVLRAVQRDLPLNQTSSVLENASPFVVQESSLDANETLRYLEIAALGTPPLDLSFATNESRSEFLKNSSWQLLPCGSVRGTGPFPSHARCWAQDAAATVAATVVKGDTVLDACAAPGGKTMQLISAGHLVTAVDVSESRIKTLKENLDRLNFDADVRCGGLTMEDDGVFYDAVLVDAPCTCTGTARRRPEVLRKTAFGDLLSTQRLLLDAALTKLRPGGCLVYSTCSILQKENSMQIDRLLQRPDVELWPLDPPTGFDTSCLRNGTLQILPWHLESYCDAHYVARLRKVR